MELNVSTTNGLHRPHLAIRSGDDDPERIGGARLAIILHRHGECAGTSTLARETDGVWPDQHRVKDRAIDVQAGHMVDIVEMAFRRAIRAVLFRVDVKAEGRAARAGGESIAVTQIRNRYLPTARDLRRA